MNRKRILSFIMVMVMVFAMAATACGKKEEAAEKEGPKQEEKVEASDKSDAEDAKDKAEPEAADQVDTIKEKLTEEDIEALKASIAETVTKEYLESNNVAVEDFKWPESSSNAWKYLSELILQYISKTFMGFDEELEHEYNLVSPDKEIADAVYNGVINWYESSGIENYKYFEDATGVLQVDTITSIDVAAYK